MSGGIWEKNTVNQNFPEIKEDPEFMRIYRGDPLNLTRETPVCETVDKHEMHEVRTPDFAYTTYEGNGYKRQLKNRPLGNKRCEGSMACRAGKRTRC